MEDFSFGDHESTLTNDRVQVFVYCFDLGSLDLYYVEKVFVSFWFFQKLCFKHFLLNFGERIISLVAQGIFSNNKFFSTRQLTSFYGIISFELKLRVREWRDVVNCGEPMPNYFGVAIVRCKFLLFRLIKIRKAACEDWAVA